MAESLRKNYVGIIPAAGKGNRLGKLPFSKELFPYKISKGTQETKVEVVSSHLIRSMTNAGVNNIHIILRNGKWDLPTYFGSGKKFESQISYSIAELEYGVPFTVNQVFPFVSEKNVVFGFPDIVFQPLSIIKELTEKLENEKHIALVLGIIPVSNPAKFDMVAFENDIVEDIVIKPENDTGLEYAWITAAWRPDFSNFLNNFVSHKIKSTDGNNLKTNEYHMGDVIKDFIRSGNKVKTVPFKHGSLIDIGTIDDLDKYLYSPNN